MKFPNYGVFPPNYSTSRHPNGRDRVTFGVRFFDTSCAILPKVTMDTQHVLLVSLEWNCIVKFAEKKALLLHWQCNPVTMCVWYSTEPLCYLLWMNRRAEPPPYVHTLVFKIFELVADSYEQDQTLLKFSLKIEKKIESRKKRAYLVSYSCSYKYCLAVWRCARGCNSGNDTLPIP